VSTPVASSCDSCERGKFSLGGTPLCDDCEDGKYSAGGEDVCYDLAVDFETCPEHSDGVVENDCMYLYQGRWTPTDENDPSPFGAGCRELAKCDYDHTTLSDKYYLMCMECAEGYVPIGINAESRGECGIGRFVQECLPESELGNCPEDPLRDDDCNYWFEAAWEDVSGGQVSPYRDDCVSYSVCSSVFGEFKNEYWMVCTACTDGTIPFHVDITGSSVNLGNCHSSAISFCYSPTQFATCPDAGSSAANLLNRCEYVGRTGGSVQGANPSPIAGCTEYELIDVTEVGGGAKKYEIGCIKCANGKYSGDLTPDGYIGSCYIPPQTGSLIPHSDDCGDGVDDHGKDVICKYLEMPDSATQEPAWVAVEGSGDSGVEGCLEFKLCRYFANETHVDLRYMCTSCKDEHLAVYNGAFSEGACSGSNEYPIDCEFTGIATPSPTPAPTARRTDSPTAAPTAEPTPKPDPLGDVMTNFTTLVSMHLEMFLGLLALFLTFIGILVYKCYERDKLRDRYSHDEDRKMFEGMNSFFQNDEESSRGSSDREMEMTDNPSEVMNALRDSKVGGAEWVKRFDPSGKEFFENVKTRKVTWTDHSKDPKTPNNSTRSAAAPMRTVFSGEIGSDYDDDASYNFENTPRGVGEHMSVSGGSAEGRGRRGSDTVQVLAKKPPAPPPKAGGSGGGVKPPAPPPKSAGPAPPPPPKGWASAKDPQGRLYYWNLKTGQTTWKVQNCTPE
jgi:hypothetical protein